MRRIVMLDLSDEFTARLLAHFRLQEAELLNGTGGNEPRDLVVYGRSPLDSVRDALAGLQPVGVVLDEPQPIAEYIEREDHRAWVRMGACRRGKGRKR